MYAFLLKYYLHYVKSCQYIQVLTSNASVTTYIDFCCCKLIQNFHDCDFHDLQWFHDLRFGVSSPVLCKACYKETFKIQQNSYDSVMYHTPLFRCQNIFVAALTKMTQNNSTMDIHTSISVANAT